MFAEAIQAELVLSSERESRALAQVLATPQRWMTWLWTRPLRQTIRNAEQLLTFLKAGAWRTWSESDIQALQSRLALLVKLHDAVLLRTKTLPFARNDFRLLNECNDRLDSYAETMQMLLEPALVQELNQRSAEPRSQEEPSDWREFVRSLEG